MHTLKSFVGAMLLAGIAAPGFAQTTPLVRISHQSTSGSVYPVSYGSGLTQSRTPSMFTTHKGPANGSTIWDFAHVGNGSGWNGRNFMRYSRWRQVDGDPRAGFSWALNEVAPAGGWSALRNSPLYFRWRMRVNQPMTESVGHGAMKWLIFGGPGLAEGNSRFIVFLYAGGYTAGQLGRSGTDAAYTGLCLNAGVSGSRAYALVPNGSWVHVQLAVRYGATGTAYQRAYINNNNAAAPDFQNTSFPDLVNQTWVFPDVGGGNPGEMFWGNIVSTNSATATDFNADFMDFEVDDAFDPNWSTGGGGSPPPPSAPAGVRIITAGADVALMLGALGAFFGVRRLRRAA
jgi:hypothetical protein